MQKKNRAPHRALCPALLPTAAEASEDGTPGGSRTRPHVHSPPGVRAPRPWRRQPACRPLEAVKRAETRRIFTQFTAYFIPAQPIESTGNTPLK